MRAPLVEAIDLLYKNTDYSDPRLRIIEYKDGKFKQNTLYWSQWADNVDAVEYTKNDGLIICDNPDTLYMAATLGDWKLEKNVDKKFLMLPTQLLLMKASKAMYNIAAQTIEEHYKDNTVFDIRTAKLSFVIKDCNDSFFQWWRNVSFKYISNETFDDKLAYAYCRNRFFDIIDVVWNDSFIIRSRNVGKQSSIKTLKRASIIANLLLLDSGNFEVFNRKAQCSAQVQTKLKSLEVPIQCMSSEMQKIYFEVERLRDISNFWLDASDKNGWALRFDTEDLEDNLLDITKEKFAHLAEIIGLRNYLRAYEAGITASDILI